MLKICKYVIYDILRSKVLIAYMLFLMAISFSLFALSGDSAKSTVSVMSVVLIIVPLISVVFSTTYFYNSYQFIELLVAQPVSRVTLLSGVYTGVAASLVTVFALGVGIPVCIYIPDSTGAMLVVSGLALTLTFVSLAFWASVITRDKARGIGLSLLLWFYFAVLYDAIVLIILFAFNEYPLDKAVIALASLNPIDLSRILVLMKLDIAALMGFTGAVYKQFLGTMFGLVYAVGLLLLWITLPLGFAFRIFGRKDL